MHRFIVALSLALACAASGCHSLLDGPGGEAAGEHTIVLQAQGVLTADAVFYVDGRRVGQGRTVRVPVSSEPHEVAAKAPGYVLVKQMIQPPYDETYPYRLTFMVEHQERYQNGAAPAGDPVAQAPAGAPPAGAPPARPAPALVSGAHSSTPQRTAYAVVVGIEHYRDLPTPSGAKADAEGFASVLKTTLGLPDANVRVAIDERATRTDIERHLAWLKANVPPGGRVYFFFSGHGAPDAASGTPYLVPYDGDAQAIVETSLPVSKVLEALKATRAKETLAFVDTCFSGAGGRSVLPKGARPLVRVADPAGAGAIALFASSSGSEISGPSQDGQHGVFTKYLIEGIGEAKADADGDGQLTLKELVDWVTPRVTREAKEQNRAQTPRLAAGAGVGDTKDLAVAWGLR